jgi:hypothetical protein
LCIDVDDDNVGNDCRDQHDDRHYDDTQTIVFIDDNI